MRASGSRVHRTGVVADPPAPPAEADNKGGHVRGPPYGEGLGWALPTGVPVGVSEPVGVTVGVLDIVGVTVGEAVDVAVAVSLSVGGIGVVDGDGTDDAEMLGLKLAIGEGTTLGDGVGDGDACSARSRLPRVLALCRHCSRRTLRP